MSEDLDTKKSNPCLAKSSKDTLDWKLCILCQESTGRKGTLVQNPRNESYQKLLEVVEERASLQDGKYVDIQGHPQFNKETFFEKKPMWHRGCYSEATNPMSIQRARDRLQHAMSTGSYVAKKRGHKRKWSEMDESATPGSSAPFTRSATEPLRKAHCFFCQKDDGQKLLTAGGERRIGKICLLDVLSKGCLHYKYT